MGHIVAVPYSRTRIHGKRRTKLNLIVEEFLNSEAEAVEYVTEENEYKDLKSKYYSLRNAINRYEGVALVMRGDKIYMVKTDVV